ncbi:hypothetical protein I4U23_023122 [Adineta vaga]|nr:hypothetical protein I4U23_023122 [Adineta vaga]
MQSLLMTLIVGQKFQCAQTTCFPFLSLTTANIRNCQIKCLVYTQCKAVTFHESTLNCELFINISDQIGNMLSDTDVITTITIDETRYLDG